MGLKHQKQNPPNHPQQDSPVPCMPCKQTPWQPTPGLNGNRWLEDLFRELSQHSEPPIPAPSQASETHDDPLTCEPEPEVALTQSMDTPFAHPTTPSSIIIINNTPVGSPLPFLLPQRSLPLPLRTQPPPPLNPTMRLGRYLWTCDQPLKFLEPLSMIQSTKSWWHIGTSSTLLLSWMQLIKMR
ncbi:hypothetical protein O181_032382 [Austropuccinia psidii MF-1]|uniref:Uncharacterized protein n=1 Tax=Austropuccinia psidii MF-1 TaxID=1389203 RepID=A0A9Q3CZD1_9BASI|nr:hypothetical protein [Austropuccinia psidii MF-1]